jgi:protein SCO1/2
LIDRNRHIRGIYEGTSLKDVKRLIDEIKVLVAEYNSARKENVNPIR